MTNKINNYYNYIDFLLYFFRDTMIQAVRSVVGPAGDKMSDAVRKSLVSTLTCLLTDDDSSTRLCAAGALGVLLRWLPDNLLQSTVTQYILGKIHSLPIIYFYLSI